MFLYSESTDVIVNLDNISGIEINDDSVVANTDEGYWILIPKVPQEQASKAVSMLVTRMQMAYIKGEHIVNMPTKDEIIAMMD